MKVLLASKSPRRKELLKKVIPTFAHYSPEVDEDYVGTSPRDTVEVIAKRKLDKALEEKHGFDMVISADTMVAVKGQLLGKPKDKEDARRMLTLLSKNPHEVYTAVAVYYNGEHYLLCEVSKVTLSFKDDAEIEQYISDKKHFDKAGAYAIQDEEKNWSYKGSYDNIMGLPTERLAELLKTIIRPEVDSIDPVKS